RLPGALEEDPVLRVHELDLARVEPEKGGVEEVDVAQDPLRLDVVVAPHELGVDPHRDQLLGGEYGNPLAPGDEARPEALDVGRAGEAAGEADDGEVGLAPYRALRADARGGGLGGRCRWREVTCERADRRVLEELDERDLAA